MTAVALVVGAAGDIGRATCEGLLERGLRVVGWDIEPRPPSLSGVDWRIVDLGTGDVPDDLADDIGRLRYVFHVVGGSEVAELAEPDPVRVPLDVIRRTVSLNLLSAYGVLRATVGQVRAVDGDRSYTFVSSTNSLGGYGAPGYSAAKAGLHGLVHALAVPLGRDGIRINAVALGTTRTANYARIATELGGSADFRALGRKFPRGAVLEPAEAARALMSVGLDNPAVSGSVLVADAAQSIQRGVGPAT